MALEKYIRLCYNTTIMSAARHAQEAPTADQSLMAEFLGGGYDTGELTAVEAVDLLTYPDAPLEEPVRAVAVEHAMQSDSTVYYAHELQGMVGEIGLEKVLELASYMRDAGVAATRALGIEPSPYARSVTWALWDMAKQRYMSKPENLEEAGPDYLYRDQTGDPITTPAVRQTIIDRHVGWEVDAYLQQPGENRYLFPIMGTRGAHTVNTIHRTGRRNSETNELNSHDLARTGEAAIGGLRTAARNIPAQYQEARAARRVSGIGGSMLGNSPRGTADAFHAAELAALKLAAANIRTVPASLKQVREWDPTAPVPPPTPIALKPGDIRAMPTWDEQRGRYVTPTQLTPQYASPLERFVPRA